MQKTMLSDAVSKIIGGHLYALTMILEKNN